MAVFSHPDFDTHEHVYFWNDEAAGLRAIAAIHRASPNNAIGGCRMWAYESDETALADVLRLSRAMSYKCAMADIAMGGGKCVIIGDAKTQKTPELLRSMGRFIETIGGRFYTGEDVGIGIDDVAVMREATAYLVGRPGADSSPVAGYGVYLGMRAAAEHAFGAPNLKGRRVAVQGLGQVGYALARHLHDEGAELLVADVNSEAVSRAQLEFGGQTVATDEILLAECDILAPCALGGVIDDKAVGKLKCRIVAGAANNQLAQPGIAEALHKRSILYAPDYVINAGGVINNALTLSPNFSGERVRSETHRIGETLAEVFARADTAGINTDRAAALIAEERMAARDGARRAARTA